VSDGPAVVLLPTPVACCLSSSTSPRRRPTDTTPCSGDGAAGFVNSDNRQRSTDHRKYKSFQWQDRVAFLRQSRLPMDSLNAFIALLNGLIASQLGGVVAREVGP